MPGVLMENGVPDTGDVTMGEDAHPNNHPPSKPSAPNGSVQTDRGRRVSMINGAVVSPADGRTDVPATKANQDGPPEASHALEIRPSSPPYIKRVETSDYKDLAELITRLVQETFNDLAEVVRSMADMSAAGSRSDLLDGRALTHASAGTNSEISVRKRQRLMAFVQHRKAQLIKLLVLTQWSRQTEEVRVAIDLFQWLRAQLTLQDEACLELGRLKLALGPAKLPNPDLVTALEVLTTGRASWMPDLGYIPLESLSPREILKTLRNMNTLLSIRLNLHEELPAHFRTFHIRSGRATFVVADEFEVDLSIADEDPTSQLYFIDFRFAFNPVDPEVLPGRLKDEIERRANELLKSDGLAGCYDFLHELVLTHKINVLRRQAQELSRGKWTESLRLEMVRRSLVVQYWPNRLGPKSWIQIGIDSGQKHAKRSPVAGQIETTSRITVRWTRDGKEVKDAPIVVDLANLSMEAVLKHVVALHTNHYLRSIRDRILRTPLYANRVLLLALTTSRKEPVKSSMRMQLTPCSTATLTVEPVDGRFALQPASLRFNQTENSLNHLKEPASEASGHLSNLRCLIAKEEIEHRARSVQWEQLRTLMPRTEDLKRVFSRDTLQVSYFTRKGWSPSWLVAASIGMSGEAWWIIELLPNSIGYTFGDHRRVPITSTAGKAIDPTYQFLSRLEKAAAGMITQYVNIRALNKHGIEHTLLSPNNKFPKPTSTSPTVSEASTLNPSSPNPITIPPLLLRFSSLMSLDRSPSPRRMRPWAKELIRVSYQGGSSVSGQCTLVVEARLLNASLFESISAEIDRDIAFHPTSGAFAFRLRCQIGEPLISQIRDRLQRIERLIVFLAAVRTYNLRVELLSLSRIVFRYPPPVSSAKPSPDDSDTYRYLATITFEGSSTMSLLFEKDNPHVRVQDFLTRILNTTLRHGLEHVTMLLAYTLPLLQALDAIESTPSASPGPALTILPHSPTHFLLRYLLPPSPNPPSAVPSSKDKDKSPDRPGELVLSLKLRQRKDQLRWFLNLTTLHPTTSSGLQNTPSALMEAAGLQPAQKDALTALLDAKGDGWEGLRTGIVAGREGVGQVVQRAHGIVQGDGGAS